MKEINFKDLNIDNIKFRIDDEFYLNKYLKAYEKIKAKPHVKLLDILETLTDFSANGSYENIASNFQLLDTKDFAYMVRTTDLEKKDYVNNVKYVSHHSYNFLEKSKVFGGELLINKIGSPGRVYIMPNLGIPVSLGMNLFMLRISKESKFREKYIWAFFNSEFGQKIIQRKVNGTVPLTIDKEAVRTLYVPYASVEFQLNIESIVNESEFNLISSRKIYQNSEIILFKEIDLEKEVTGLNPVEIINHNAKSFKESFGVTGRLDAEYYQKKYEVVIEKIKARKHDRLKVIVTINKSIEPGSDYYSDDETGLPFMRVSDFNKFGLTAPNKRLTLDFVRDNQDKIDELIPKKNTILFSKDGTVGIAHQLREDFKGVTSSAILHLKVKNEKEVIPEYLTLALNSKLVQMQAERDAGGSIIQHWRKEEIENVIVPIIDYEKQLEIAKLIEESFSLKQRSEHLLEVAKRAVEIAIEENEDIATKYINDQLK